MTEVDRDRDRDRDRIKVWTKYCAKSRTGLEPLNPSCKSSKIHSKAILAANDAAMRKVDSHRYEKTSSIDRIPQISCAVLSQDMLSACITLQVPYFAIAVKD